MADIGLRRKTKTPSLWWPNIIAISVIHLLALYVILYRRTNKIEYYIVFVSWQAAMFGISMGYHRLWSHRAYEARLPLRLILAIFGTNGFQGSIKWWVLRHRMHHRYTDTNDDPYNAQRGMFFAHIGWLFYQPQYKAMKHIDKEDLDADPIVRWQHNHFKLLTLVICFILPSVTSYLIYGDALSGFLWGGFVAHVLIWHMTFLINSLAHYIGEQEFTLDNSSRGNLVLAILTCGEGWHNFHHAFPHNYMNGPNITSWDPGKWVITFLHKYTSLVPRIYFIKEAEIKLAREIVRLNPFSWKQILEKRAQAVPRVNKASILENDAIRSKYKNCILLDNNIIDVETYINEHPGGSQLIKPFLGATVDAGPMFRKYNTHSPQAFLIIDKNRVASIE